MKKRLPAFVYLSCLQRFTNTDSVAGKTTSACKQSALNYTANTYLPVNNRLDILFCT
jgi:hypothetical protein